MHVKHDVNVEELFIFCYDFPMK